MTATSLAPFLAPAAGTVAFLLLLCVTIGAVLTLTPFSANEKLAGSENDTPSLAWAGLPVALSRGVETEDSTTSDLRLAKMASPAQPERFVREAHGGEPELWDTSARFDPDLPSLPTYTAESSAWSASAVRWWGINE